MSTLSSKPEQQQHQRQNEGSEWADRERRQGQGQGQQHGEGDIFAPDKLEALTQAIGERLSRQGTYASITDAVRGFVSEARGEGFEAESSLVMEEIVRGLENRLGIYPSTQATDPTSLSSMGGGEAQGQGQGQGNAPKSRVLLKLTVLKGSAFTALLADSHRSAENFDLKVHVHFNGQRCVSHLPVRACVEPRFGETFVLKLSESDDPLPEGGGGAAEWANVLQRRDKIHICLTRQRVRAGVGPGGAGCFPGGYAGDDFSTPREVLASAELDWRRGLMGDEQIQIPLQAEGQDGHGSVSDGGGSFGPDFGGFGAGGFGGVFGLLHVQCQIVATPAKLAIPFTGDDVERVMHLQQQQERLLHREFYTYCRAWWAHFAELSPLHRQRPLQMFASDGIGGPPRSVCTFLRPLRCGRLFDSPLHAARFVSLIPFQRRVQVGGKRLSEEWQHPHSFLCRGRGDSQDHALLLASLLLGFGLDTYVCLGSAPQEHPTSTPTSGGGGGSRRRGAKQAGGAGGKEEEATQPYAWVATLSGSGHPGTPKSVTLWDAVTGLRYTRPANPGEVHMKGGAATSKKKQQHHHQQQQRHQHEEEEEEEEEAYGQGGHSQMARKKRANLRVLRCPPGYPFLTLCVVFNHESFYATKQRDHRVPNLHFGSLRNPKLWKAMDETRIRGLTPPGSSPTQGGMFPFGAREEGVSDSPSGFLMALLPPRVDERGAAAALEAELKRLIRTARAEGQGQGQGQSGGCQDPPLSLSTVWDEELSYLLSPALAAYEQERIYGTPQGGQFGQQFEFQDAIRRAVPSHSCFKGFPTCFNSACAQTSPADMLLVLLRNVVSRDILATVGDDARFALRVRVFAYPEGVVAVWLMLAVRYVPLDTL